VPYSIRSVAVRDGSSRAPDGAAVERRDYGAATILPGLVDAHTHLVAPGDGTLGDDIAKEDDDILLLQAARNARTLLHSGVTTLRENGAKGRVAFSLREGVRRQLAPGPRMVICGRPIAMTGGHMGYFGSEADGEQAVRAEVRKLLKEGADYIKIVASGGSTRTSDPNRASYTVAELVAMTDEAHRHGTLTAAHCTSADSVQNCLDAGVDIGLDAVHDILRDPDHFGLPPGGHIGARLVLEEPAKRERELLLACKRIRSALHRRLSTVGDRIQQHAVEVDVRLIDRDGRELEIDRSILQSD